MKFQQLQNMHTTKYNKICMYTTDTMCLVQDSLTKFPRWEREGCYRLTALDKGTRRAITPQWGNWHMLKGGEWWGDYGAHTQSSVLARMLVCSNCLKSKVGCEVSETDMGTANHEKVWTWKVGVQGAAGGPRWGPGAKPLVGSRS